MTVEMFECIWKGVEKMSFVNSLRVFKENFCSFRKKENKKQYLPKYKGRKKEEKSWRHLKKATTYSIR